MLRKKLISIYLNKKIKKQPFRFELFNIEQLSEYARLLAGEQKTGSGTRSFFLRDRLTENESKIQSYVHNVLTSRTTQYISPATEWLTDNFYLIEEQIQLARRHFPESYSKELPFLVNSPFEHFPRIYGLSAEYISHVDAQLDEESLKAFFLAYQEITPLKLGELWAIPIMMRLLLIENLRRIVIRLQQDQKDREMADEWMEKAVKISREKPSALAGVISDMASSELPMSSAFVSEFSKRLALAGSSLHIIKNWFDQKLSEEGVSAQELMHTENQNQAADQVSVSHSIKSLRFISSLDWRAFVEDTSLVEKILKEDPAGVYGLMDFDSRDFYRHQVEQLAHQSGIPEKEVALKAVSLAKNKKPETEGNREKHVGFYIIDDGLIQLKKETGIKDTIRLRWKKWRKDHPLLHYTFSILFFTMLGTCFLMDMLYAERMPIRAPFFIIGFLSLFLMSHMGVFLVNWITTLTVPPSILPRMDFSKGIPAVCRTIVVVPSMISSKKGIDKLVSDLEIHHLSNTDRHLYFALLTDFTDADQAIKETDDELIQYIKEQIRLLNEKYKEEREGIFYLFHRPRIWNASEQAWIGYERKRGKLMAFSRFLATGSTADFMVTEGNLPALKGIPYIITLDADTQLPPCSAHKLVGTLSHILNRPVIDPIRRVVTKGYGILQPRVANSIRSCHSSLFAHLFTDQVGLDPYTRTVSDVYQDLFQEGSFVGKGILDVETMETVLSGRFPENRILSHDLLESAFTRSGLVTDVEVYETFPSAYNTDANRRHRWIRGDWQILPWIGRKVPVKNGKEKNPLSRVNRWKITDNLRRSLVSPAIMLMLAVLLFTEPFLMWVLFSTLLIIGFLPTFVSIPIMLAAKPREEDWRLHLMEVFSKVSHQLKQVLFLMTTLPYDAWLCMDAIVRSLWRVIVSKRHLLQWQTSEDAHHSRFRTLTGYYLQMWFSPFFSVITFILTWKHSYSFLVALPFILGWFFAPLIVWFMSRPIPVKEVELTEEQTDFLRYIARKTWNFFEVFVNATDNWLAPDNYQERPEPVIATRTSPTNIGLSLLANLAASDMGYLSTNGLLERTENTFRTLSSLKRFRGHFYNWYDTRTLEPLYPLYISMVDSGNLAGNFITLGQGLKEKMQDKVYSPILFEGILDTIRVIQATYGKMTALSGLEKRIAGAGTPSTIPEAYTLLQWINQEVNQLAAEKPDNNWLQILSHQVQDQLDDLLYLFPWLEKDYRNLLEQLPEEETGSDVARLMHKLSESIPTLEQVTDYAATVSPLIKDCCRLIHPADEQKKKVCFTDWGNDLALTASRAGERIGRIGKLTYQCEQFGNMDFRFLYNKKKKLFTIGYNVMDQRYDSASYDMLASEARLGSYIAIAKGQVPIDHWFAMGRLITLHKAKPVLLSWSGSMFEYLMPLLLMPDFEETLLSLTYKGAVEEQISYGKRMQVPWGISESGYNRPDTLFNYQYRAFGVPTLGLKRGLSKDLVIAPYASVLGLMVDPEKATENMQRLAQEGHEGDYGLYEAIDYTPTHLPLNEKWVNVYSYMAHHQGMSLLSLVNFLKDNPMQKRFISCPTMKAFELLLQERVPHSIDTHLIVDHSRMEQDDLQVVQARTEEVSRAFKKAGDLFEANLLSNGRYRVMLNTSGSGYSQWNNLAITRWRKDATTDSNGLFLWLRDKQTGNYWSAGFQPTLNSIRDYEVVFTQAYAEFRQRHSGLDITTSVCVSPEDDVELRCIRLSNHSHQKKEIEVTTYGEVVIAPLAADEAHPVFSNLFVQSRYDKELATIFCTRRASSEKDRPPYLFHSLITDHADSGEVTFETDRSRFLGRGNTTTHPQAMETDKPLSGREGAVLDPVLSLRRTVTILPGKTVRICMITGIAATEETIGELAEKYRNPRMTDRAFDLAWTHSQVVLYHLNIREAEAQLYQKLAGSLIYMNSAMRADATILKNNRKGQSGLWGYGLSGDVPIVIVRISINEGMTLVKQLVQAHAYWRLKGLITELLIINEDISVYRQPLHEEIENLINTGMEGSWLNKPGGIVIRPADQIPGEDLVLLLSCAQAVFSDKEGTFQEQLERVKLAVPVVPSHQPLFTPLPSSKETQKQEKLLYANGYGGFSTDGREYVITLEPGKNTPAPWSNVIANRYFGTVISENGGSYTWFDNSHEFRLTPWANDPIKDTSGEAFYIRDEHTGRYWSPAPLPARGETGYTIRHGFGYSVFEHTEQDIESSLTVFVMMDASVKCNLLKVKNHSIRTRRLAMTGYCEWVLGDTRTRNAYHVITQVDLTTGALYATNAYNTDYPGRIGFLDIGNQRTVTGDRGEFLGLHGTTAHPQAMGKKRLSGITGAGMDPCGAVQTIIELKPGEEKDIYVLLGSAADVSEMTSLITRYRKAGAIREALQQVHTFWADTLGTVTVDTPDPATNMMGNGWLLYQTLSCRLWARSGYYQSGGAFGFRDQLQDVMALAHTAPELMREQIILAASRQFTKGDVQHWWHPPYGRGVRTLFSDDYLWLPYVTHRYVSTTGDTGILKQMVRFLDGRELNPGEESYYDMPVISDEETTLYDHCVRSIRYGLKFGKHGLPLMGCGDWNDGMNLVGIEGKGESVWLAFFLYDVLVKFADIATRQGDEEFAGFCSEQSVTLKENINREAWDGNWYLRAWFDNGTPLGVSGNTECRIDTLPQSWSVISGAGEPERSRQGMDAVYKNLVDKDLKIIRLFTQPFDKFQPSPGYIQGYVPGVRENGGQYTHGVIWTVIAFAMMGETERAWELFDMLNPILHGHTPEDIERYKVEPYVIAADVYSATQHPGRGGWTWYTGSSSWMYRLLLETLLGINRAGDTLELTPRMRKEWKEYSVNYRFKETLYRILFKRIGNDTRLELDGINKGNTHIIPLLNDGKEHQVTYYIGGN